MSGCVSKSLYNAVRAKNASNALSRHTHRVARQQKNGKLANSHPQLDYFPNAVQAAARAQALNGMNPGSVYVVVTL